MKRVVAGVLLSLFLCGRATADLNVVCSEKVKAGQMARLLVKITDAKSSAIDVDFDRDPLDVEKVGDRTVFTGVGTYVVKVTAFYLDKEGNPKIEKVRKTVEFEGGLPPGPGPGPLPPVPGQKLNVTLIYDASLPDQAVADVIRSAAMRESLEKAGHKVRWYDKDSPVLTKTNLKGKADAAGLPCVVIQTSDGKLWPAGAAVPWKSESDVLAAVKKAGG